MSKDSFLGKAALEDQTEENSAPGWAASL